ncbi:MAG: M20/M25/M40 family metallo-hydrolase [Clostridia bacterium]|nr:M20/M25/M40 family metallo-hydrolase [Clostridia bacterium]
MNAENQKSLENFQKIIRAKTISNKEGNFDRAVFDAFLPMLKEMYPATFAAVHSQLMNEYGIVLHWKGRNEKLQPVVLMGHHDVVSDENQQWEHPAFEAEIHDGFVWGRGSVDNKCVFTGILEAMERLAKEGFTPERDIYFVSSNCEEVAGDTADIIAQWFKDSGIKPWFVLDEGGAIMKELPMGIKTPFAMVGVSEKGWGTVKITTSKPKACEKLVKALSKLEKSPMASQMTPALEGMLGCFADHVGAPLNFVFKNLSVLRPVVKKAMESNDQTAAMIRSTYTITAIDAVHPEGKIAEKATATLKLRIAPHDSFETMLTHIKSVLGDSVEYECDNILNPPPASDHNTASFDYIRSVVNKVFPGVGVSPFILDAFTDSRSFKHICKEIYRFGAFSIDNAQFASVHNANEKLGVDVFLKSIDFYEEFIRGIK